MAGTCNECLFLFAAFDRPNENKIATVLMSVAEKGHDGCLKKLIALGANVNKQDENGHTALFYSVYKGHTNCTSELLKAGADVNMTDYTGQTALMCAARTGHFTCVRKLIRGGADVNARNLNGETALFAAAQIGHAHCVRVLLKAGADIKVTDKTKGQTALMYAAADRCSDCVKELLMAGANVNATDNFNSTALMYAATKYGHVQCVKELIQVGADVNRINKIGLTALLGASQGGHTGCLKELLKAGADVNLGNKSCNIALMVAARMGHVDCVRELIKAGADVNIRTENGTTPLIAASHSTNENMSISELLKAGAELNSADDNGNTPLMVAIEQGNESTVQLLLEKGSAVNVKNHFGETALYRAVVNGHAKFERVKAKNDKKALVLPITENFSPSARLVLSLLKAGAVLNESSSDNNPCTAHVMKKDKCDVNILKMLSAAGGNIRGINTFTSNDSLQNFTRKCIRQHLKLLHRDTNLFVTIIQLGLPPMLKSYLLLHMLENIEINLQGDQNELLLKASAGDVEGVHNLIRHGVNVNTHDGYGMTALMIASEAGHVKLVDKLIKEGADVNIQSTVGYTALIYAVKKRRKKCAMKLLKNRANVNIRDRNGSTALTFALDFDDCSQTFFKVLIEYDADPNVPDHNGATPLQHAVLNNNFVRTEKLISLGADVNLTINKNPAIVHAALNGKEDIVKCLIEAGADVNKDAGDGKMTSLMAASEHGNVGCVKQLIQAGAELNIAVKGGDGMTPLIGASREGHVGCVRLLIQAGADLNIQDNFHRTALRHAALCSKDACFTTLWENGAEFDTCFLTYFINKVLSTDSAEDPQLTTAFKLFVMRLFEAGVTPDFAVNAGGFAALTAAYQRFRGRSPLKLRTMCKRILYKERKPDINRFITILPYLFWAGVQPEFSKKSKFTEAFTVVYQYFGEKAPFEQELEKKVPPHTGCPMTTSRKGRRYFATVAKGKATSLQGDKSDVRLGIKKGCPKRAFMMEVRTDLSKFESIVPDDECFISPIVKVLAPAETSASSYILRIPHCLDGDDDRTKVKVRMIHENRNPAVILVPSRAECTDGVLFYDIDDKFIELYTTHFTEVVCTICQTPYHCRGRINSFWFASFDTDRQSSHVELRPYFGGVLYTIAEFKQSVEAAVNLRYVTQGSLKKSKTSFNPEFGQIKLSLKIEDPTWVPRQGLDKWDPKSRTFTEDMQLSEVLGDENTHKCREAPFEAAIYSLKAQGEKIQKFKSNSKMEMTIEVEGAGGKQEKKQHCSTLELPVDFSEEDVTRPLSTGGLDSRESFETKRHLRISKEDVKARLQVAKLDELPVRIADSEISKLAILFKANTLEAVALQHFDTSENEIDNYKMDNIGNTAKFKRELLCGFRNKGNSRQDLYRVLLNADSEGLMDEVDLQRVEELILQKKK